jgi:cytochrome P450
VPAADRQRVKAWTQAIMQPLDINRTPETLTAGNEAALAFTDYLRHLAAQRRDHPQDDLLTALLQTSEAADNLSLSAEVLLANCIFLINAGHETTMYLLGNGLFSLLQHPDQWAALQQEPSLIENAVEEIIRYESPSQMAYRTARADVALGGKRIRRGEAILACWAAANRDPAQFAEPDCLNIRRPDSRHLAFGLGIHFCLGAALARLEAQIAFELMATRLAGIGLLSDTPEWNYTLMVRGLRRLPVSLVPA